MKRFNIIGLLLIMACTSKPGDISITIDHSAQVVKVTGLTETTLNGIRRDSLSREVWQNLFPVTAMPVDTDMRNIQPPVKGKYQIIGNVITFTPDTSFKTGRTYFARYYRYDKEISVLDMVIHKRTPGKANYTELIFKY